jgi:hypothetical protein
LGALPTTPLGPLISDSGLTPTAVALYSRKQQFAARLPSACVGSTQKETYNNPTSGAPICRVIKIEHAQGKEADTTRWTRPDEEPAVKTVILSDDTEAQSQAKRWARESEMKVVAGVCMW